MANAYFILLFVLYVLLVFIDASDTSKKHCLVLNTYSETYVVAELNKLRTHIKNQNTIIQTLTSEIDILKTVKVKQELDIHIMIATFTAKLADKKSEIQNLSNILTSNLAEIKNLSGTMAFKLVKKMKKFAL